MLPLPVSRLLPCCQVFCTLSHPACTPPARRRTHRFHARSFNIKEATGLDITLIFISARTSYRWDPKQRALLVRTTWVIGADTSLAKDFNVASLLPLYAKRTGGDARKASLNYILHTIEEWGSLSSWLPALYAANKKPTPVPSPAFSAMP